MPDVTKTEDLNTSLKWVVKSSAFVLITLILSKALVYIYRIIIARGFGVEVYGLFSIALMISSIAIVIGAFGMERAIVRFVAFHRARKEYGKIKGVILDSLSIGIPLTSILTLLIFLSSNYISASFFHNPSLAPMLRVFILTVPLAYLSNICYCYLRANEKIILSSVINDIITNILRIILLGILIFIGFNFRAVGYSYLIAYFIVLLILIYYSQYKTSPLVNFKEKAVYNKKELFSYSWPLVFAALITTLYGTIDITIIGHYLNAYQVGLYSAALSIAVLVTTMHTIISPVIIPLLTRFYSLKNFDSIQVVSKQLYKWIILFNLPVLTIVVLFPGTFLNLMFGPEFIAAQGVLRLLAIAYFLASSGLIAYYSFDVIKKTKISLLITGSSIFVNVLLDILLVPMYGINGAGISTLISMVCYTLLSIMLGYKYLKISPFSKDLIKGIIADLVALSIIYLIRDYIKMDTLSAVILGILFIAIYFIGLIMLKAYNSNDKMILEAIEKKIGIPVQKYLWIK